MDFNKRENLLKGFKFLSIFILGLSSCFFAFGSICYAYGDGDINRWLFPPVFLELILISVLGGIYLRRRRGYRCFSLKTKSAEILYYLIMFHLAVLLASEITEFFANYFGLPNSIS